MRINRNSPEELQDVYEARRQALIRHRGACDKWNDHEHDDTFGFIMVVVAFAVMAFILGGMAGSTIQHADDIQTVARGEQLK